MDNVLTGKEAREKLMVGVNKVADAVKLTLGAAGANAVLEADVNPGHRVTNDGVSVARAIFLEDPVENMGANIIKEIANRADKDSGDGTTTATVLTQAILKEGLNADISPMQLKRELDECLPFILEAIDAQKKEITVDEVGQVATISAEDESIGALIQEAYQTIGKDGIIELDNSNLPETFIEYGEGILLHFAGWFGAYSSTEQGKAVYKNPKILISKEKIATTDQIEGLFKQLANEGINELVLYVEDIDMAVASRLALTHINGGFKTLIIKSPTVFKDWLYEDFAKLTGATVVDFANGKTFKNLTIADLGTCEKIITTKDETRVLGTKDVTEHLEAIEEAGKLDDQQKLRASWLQTKVAVIKLGANSESELSYRRLKTIDAISAARLALEDGIVVGGGIALLVAAKKLRSNPELLALGISIGGQERKPSLVGVEILAKALKAPFEQICENAGVKVDHVLETDDEFSKESGSINSWTLGESKGFNAKTGEIVDMWEAGIVDPSKVVKNSVKNALSVASTVLTCSIVTTLARPDALTLALQQAIKPAQQPYG